MKKNQTEPTHRNEPNDFKPNRNVFGLPNQTFRFRTFTVWVIIAVGRKEMKKDSTWTLNPQYDFGLTWKKIKQSILVRINSIQ